MDFHESWIKERLPDELAGEDISRYFEEYDLNGLTVTAMSELGGDIPVYEAKDENDLRLWEFDKVCRDLSLKAGTFHSPKKWRFTKTGAGRYIERKTYDYDAVEDTRLYTLESYLRLIKPVLPPEMWEARVRENVALMNRWYLSPHWDYDQENLCFIEVSASRALSPEGAEEPEPGAVIKVID